LGTASGIRPPDDGAVYRLLRRFEKPGKFAALELEIWEKELLLGVDAPNPFLLRKIRSVVLPIRLGKHNFRMSKDPKLNHLGFCWLCYDVALVLPFLNDVCFMFLEWIIPRWLGVGYPPVDHPRFYYVKKQLATTWFMIFAPLFSFKLELLVWHYRT
jgi:hypothetical protein